MEAILTAFSRGCRLSASRRPPDSYLRSCIGSVEERINLRRGKEEKKGRMKTLQHCFATYELRLNKFYSAVEQLAWAEMAIGPL